MDPEIQRRYDRYATAPLTWSLNAGLEKQGFAFRDNLTRDLGPDSDGRFEKMADRLMMGNYYPPDAIDFFGPWRGRQLQEGDRVLQRARLFPFLKRPVLWALTEIYVAERTDRHCKLGYLTTKRHFGRGVWTVEVKRTTQGIELVLNSVAAPGSWLFWAGLPYARFLQKRAALRAISCLRSI